MDCVVAEITAVTLSETMTINANQREVQEAANTRGPWRLLKIKC